MSIYIGIEDLVANAVIELLENSREGQVLFSELDEYGARVVECINEETDEQAILILSKERTNAFLHDYSEYFEAFSTQMGKGIRLKDGIDVDVLWGKFRGYLSAEILRAFMSKRALNALGV